MNICICDNKKDQHDIIIHYINAFPLLPHSPKIVSRFSGAELIRDYMNENFYDILFMDVKIGDENGVEVAQIVKSLHPNSIIIFISGHPDHVFEAFSVEPLHFLVKPVTQPEFDRVFFRAINRFNALYSFLPASFLSDRAVIRIPDILYCEGYHRHVMIYTVNGTYKSVSKLSDIFQKLYTHGFIQTHQGFVVNMSQISRFDKESVTLRNGIQIPVSQRKRASALKSFDDYLKGVLW